MTHLRVDSDIITKEMPKTISCFLNNTVLGLDRILNKALKTYRLLIVLWLINVAKIYFAIGYYPRFKRAIITKEIARTINCLLNNIVLGPDRILNKALKIYRLFIVL